MSQLLYHAQNGQVGDSGEDARPLVVLVDVKDKGHVFMEVNVLGLIPKMKVALIVDDQSAHLGVNGKSDHCVPLLVEPECQVSTEPA